MDALRGRVAVVTGASSGIGRAIALRLADDGVEIVLAGRDLDALASTRSEVLERGGTAEILELDVADTSSIEAFARRVTQRVRRLDILVNGAGVYARGSWTEASAKDLDALMHTNVRGCFALTQALLPLLVRARADVVFVNSSVVDSSGCLVGQYAASQQARRALAESLRAEVNEHGVRVLCVYPGRTATPMQEKIHEAEKKRYDAGRLLQASDVADAVSACLALAETAEVTELTIRPRFKA